MKRLILIALAVFISACATTKVESPAVAYFNRGLAYQEKGEYDKAITEYNRAIKINPRLAMAHIDRGLVYREQLGNKEEACSDWKRACDLGECYYYTIAKRMGSCE